MSNIERAARAPSLAAIDYFAQRLGVPVEAVWDEAGVGWIIDMARELLATGRGSEVKPLLVRTLRNLERDAEPRVHVMVALHRELAASETDRAQVQAHLVTALDVADDDDSLLVERAQLHAQLGDLAIEDRRLDDALQHYQTAISLFTKRAAERARLKSAMLPLPERTSVEP